MTTILERLEEISENLHQHFESVAALFLWMTWWELACMPQQSDRQVYHTGCLIPPISHQLKAQIHRANPILVKAYLDIFIHCTNINCGQAILKQGSEQLARVASTCLLYALSTIDPTSPALEAIRPFYIRIFLPRASLEGFPSHYAIGAIHNVFYPDKWDEWKDYRPPTHEHALITHALKNLAHEYKTSQYGKVPDWILSFTLHSLSLGHLPPSIITDFLSIIAIDLGCGVSYTRNTTSDERCVHI